MVKIYAELIGDSEKFRIKSLSDNKNDVDKGTRYMGAQPFFTPNVEKMGKEAEKQLTEVIKEVLR